MHPNVNVPQLRCPGDRLIVTEPWCTGPTWRLIRCQGSQWEGAVAKQCRISGCLAAVGEHRIPLGRVLAGAKRHDSLLLAPALGPPNGLAPPGEVTVRLDAGYDSVKSHALLVERSCHGPDGARGVEGPVEATRGWSARCTR